jgi:hypothetical protein
MGKTFVISEESINSYGFRVKTDGIDLSEFEKNPIMLWSHTRSWSDKTDAILPIGYWKNVRKEDGKLFGEPVFDETDDFAQKIAKKVENGTLRTCSIGIRAVETSNDEKDLVLGQTNATVTKCMLREVSITDIPSNKNSIALYDDNGEMIELSEKIINDVIFKINNNMTENEKQELTVLRDSDTAKDAEIKQLKEKLNEINKKAIIDLVDKAVADKKILTGKKNHFVELGEKVGIETLKETIESMNEAVKPTDFINRGKSFNTSDRSDWDYHKWLKEDESGLKLMQKNEPEEFKKLLEKLNK